MKYIIFLIFLFLIPVSQAEVHFEPYGSIGASYSSSVSPGPLFMNYVLGARLGYRFLSVSTGLDLFWTHYDTGNGKGSSHLEVRPSSESTKGFNEPGIGTSIQYSEVSEPFQPLSIGAFAIVDLPILFNAYGTAFYSFGDRRSINHQGYGLKAGVSYLSTFYLQVNLELQWSHYICAEKADCLNQSNSFNILSAMLSLSLPLSTDIFDFDDSDNFDNSDSSEEEESEIEME